MKRKFYVVFVVSFLAAASLSCSAEKGKLDKHQKINGPSTKTEISSETKKDVSDVVAETSGKVEEPVITSSNTEQVAVETESLKEEKKALKMKEKKPMVLPSVSIQKMVFPLPDEYKKYVSSPQGLRDAILNVNSGGGATLSTYHNALDIACPDKTPVYAAKDGYVKTVYPSYYNGPYNYKGHPQYGGMIEILHPDGTTTLYAHLSLTEVLEGAYVKAGQEIAWSGGVKNRRGSGNSTGAHLHFAVYVSIEDMFLFEE